MLRSRHPVRGKGTELVHGHTELGSLVDGVEVTLSVLRHCLFVADEQPFEKRPRAPIRMLRCESRHPVENKFQLRVDRMLNPRCTILVEGSDAVLWWYEFGVRRLFRGAIVP